MKFPAHTLFTMYKCALRDAIPIQNSILKHGENQNLALEYNAPYRQNLPMNNDRIASLEARKAQIDAQLKAARARDRKQKRKDDTQRKIIAGSLAERHAQQNPNSEFAAIMLRLIQEYVVADNQRALFDLKPLAVDDPRRKPPAPARQQWQKTAGQKK